MQGNDGSSKRASSYVDYEEDEYGFEYEDEDEEGPNVALENQYYNSKVLKIEDPSKALEGFLQVVRMEAQKGEW